MRRSASCPDTTEIYVFYSTPYNLRKAGYEEQEFFRLDLDRRIRPTRRPLRHVYNGFLLAIGGSSLPPRGEVGTKAIRVFTENDVIRGALAPGQAVPDTDLLRTWQIAGASHVPAYATTTDAKDFRATLGVGQLGT